MSNVQLEMIWQHEQVLPYILNELKQIVERISPVYQIYLYGSRAKTPIKDWHQLAGKDWDIIIVCKFSIIKTHIWTTDKNYHIDLNIISKQKATEILMHRKDMIELYPNSEFVASIYNNNS
jgi:predicted nucleotidyltransferase